MKTSLQSTAGPALIIGAIMLTVTMIFHPVGGNIEHLIASSVRIMVIHSLAIATIPVLMLGFWGLTSRFGADNWPTALAFIVVSLGLFAAMLAAAFNGLVVPFFLRSYNVNKSLETTELILRYGFSVNRAMDYIFIISCCVSLALWSAVSLRRHLLPRWIGYFGISLVIVALISLSVGVVFTSLTGFRIFIFGWVVWIVIAGYQLRKPKAVETNRTS